MVSGPITIKKVYLKNFISHKETEVVFEKGVTAFVGPNGAGKSSILDAIYFALTGKARRGKLEGLVNAAAPRGAEAVVKLWLDVDGREVVIERRISKSGRHEAVLKGRGRTILRVSTVNKEIEELLGLKADSLQTVAIIPQGALTRLITLTPAERLEILDELLGLNAFEEAWEKLKEYKVGVKTKKVPSQTYQPTKQGLDNLRESYSRVIAEIKEKEESIKKLSEELSKLRSELQAVGSEVKKVRSEIEELEDKQKELEARRRELISVEEELKNVRSEVEVRKKKMSELSIEVAKLKGLEEEAARLSELAGQLQKLRELLVITENLRSKKALLVSKKGELRSAEELLRELKSILSKYPEGIEKRIKKLELVRERLSKTREEIARLVERLGRLTSDQKNIEELLSKLVNELNEVLNEASATLDRRFESVSEAIAAVRDGAGRLRQRIEELKKLHQEKLSQASVEEGRAREAEEKLEILKRGFEGRCPLCGQPLTQEHRERLIMNLSSDVKARRERARQLMSEARKMEEEYSSLEDRLRKLEDLMVKLESAESKEGELKELKERLRKINEDIRNIKDRLELLEREVKELEKEESELVSAEKDQVKLEAIVRQGISEERVSSLRREVEALEEEVSALQTRASELRSELSRFFGKDFSVEDAISAAERASDRVKELREIVGRLRQSAAELERLQDEIKSYLSRASELEKKRRELLIKVHELEGVETKLKELRAAIEGLMKKEGELRSRAEDTEKRISEVEEEVKVLREDAEELRRAWYKLAVLRWIREEVLHRDKAPALIRRASLAKIEALMKKYIEFFNMSYSDVRVDERFNITLVSPYLEADVSKLSGGEVVVTAITALLALHNIVSGGRLGFLILDEPTIHLDEEKRRQLVDILKEFRGGGVIPQLIVVTHHDEVKEAADLVYEVSKDAYSRVREVSSIEF